MTVDLSRAVWRKARRSQGNGACVEVADLGDTVAVRDSKNPDGPVLTFRSKDEWAYFVEAVKAGEFD
ncbi:MAG: DUF397 domain-containing protein [Micromonosporaceae bacterium]